MDYLKVWTSFRESIAPLNDGEKGRLFDAMLLYAETGEEPAEFKGNERFLWIVAKQDIDRTAQKCEALRANASKGGYAKSKNRQALANDSKSYQTIANDSKSQQEEANLAHNIKKYKEKKSKEIQSNELFAQFWAAYPRHEAKQTALKAFEKLNPDGGLMEKILLAIEKQKNSSQWKENGGQYIPHPSTWLNQRRWEDEVKDYRPDEKKLPAQDYQQRDYSGEQDEAFERMLKLHAERFNRKENGA